MNVTSTLIKNSNGRLRPNLTEPRTAQEAAPYAEAKKVSDKANALLDTVSRSAKELQHFDNKADDLNSESGLIVKHGERRKDYSKANVASSAQFGPNNELQHYTEELEGKFSLLHEGTSYPGLDHKESKTYSNTDGLQLSWQRSFTQPSDPSKSLKEHYELTENSQGIITFTVVESDTLKTKLPPNAPPSSYPPI